MSFDPRLRDIIDLKKYFTNSKDRNISYPTEGEIRRFKGYLDSGYIKMSDFKNAFFESLSGLSNGNDLKNKWILFGKIFEELGEQYIDIKNRKKALECYEIIINEEFNFKKLGLYDNIISVWKSYALVLVRIGKYQEAIEGFKHYMPLIESSTLITHNDEDYYRDKQNALYYISLCYYFLGSIEEARLYIDRLINGCKTTDRSNYYTGLNLKASIYSKKGRYRESIKYYEEIVNNVNDDDFKNYAIGCLACNLADLNELNNAFKEINKITTSDPDSYLLDMYGYIYYKLHTYNEAIECFDNALDKIDNKDLDKDGHESEIYFHKGNALLQQKKYDDARTCYELSLSRRESIKAYNNKAVAYAFDGDQNNALSELNNALKADPTSPIVIENIAKTHSSNSSKKSFWDYWTSSNSKKIILSTVLTSIIGLIFITIFIPALVDITNGISGIEENQDNVSKEDDLSNMNITNMVKNLTSIERLNQVSQKSEISTNNLILIAIMVLFLLSPMITSAKIGAGTLELTISEIKAADISLSILE